MVLAFFANDLARQRHTSAPGPPSRIRGLTVKREEPPVVRARWVELLEPAPEARELVLPGPSGGPKRLAFRQFSIPDTPPPFGVYLVHTHRAWPVDVAAQRIGEPLTLDAFCRKAFPDAEGKAGLNRTRKRQALKYAVKRLPRSGWFLLWWAPPRTDTWSVRPESIRALGTARAVQGGTY